MNAAVEPAKFCFTIGVGVVINVEYSSAEVSVLIDQFSQSIETVPGLRGNPQHWNAGAVLVDERRQFVGLFAA